MAQRGAIFDLDGTLADTAADLLAAANVALQPHGLAPLEIERDKAFAGRGGRSMIRRSLTLAGHDPDTDEGVALTDRIYPDLLDAYRGALAVETRLFDGVEACLDDLAAGGWALGVCTNKPEAMALAVLEALGVRARFAAILGADTLPVRKPDPKHLTETALRAGADPRRCVLVGDTLTDLKTARAAGVPCILTRFGFAAEPLDSLEPDAIVDHYDQIPAVLEGLCPPDTGS
ncbi:MAG: phosphoglycolate phosphatase [Pseudomonadota bacterium]